MKPSRTKRIILNLAAAAGYVAFGMVSTGLTRSPEYFTPVWIPAGICTLFVLLWGRVIYPGVILGSILFHFYFYSGGIPEAMTWEWLWRNFNYVPLVVLQCETARLLLLRFVSTPHFHPGFQNQLVLLGRCALLALVLPLFTNLFFIFEGSDFTVVEWFKSLARWWFGDFLGIICLIAVPILIIQSKPGESVWRILRYLSPVGVYLIILVLGYRFIADREVRGVQERFETEAIEIRENIVSEFDTLIGEIELLRIRFLKEDEMDLILFEKQARQILLLHPSIESISWISMIRSEDLSEWESFIEAEHSELKESSPPDGRGTHGQLEFPYHLRVLMTVSGPEKPSAPGLDLRSFSGDTLRNAIRTGSAHLPPPLPVSDQMGAQKGMVILLPSEPANVNRLHEDYLSGAYGIFNIALRMDHFIGEIAKKLTPVGSHLILEDHTEAGEPIRLSQYREGIAIDSELVMSEKHAIFTYQTSIPVFNRSWDLRVDADRKYLANYHSSAPFFLLVGGLVFSYLLGIHTTSGYLRTRVIEETVEEKTHELREAKIEAEQYALAKSEFLAVMSHEIRTPMNGMISTAELLKNSPLDRDQAELAAIIEMSGHTLLALINEILDFSKLEAGKSQLEQKPFDPVEAVKTVEATFRAKTREKGIEFRLLLPEMAAEIPQVVGDRNRILQVLMNLVSNAVKFTSVGAVELSMQLTPLEGNQAEICYAVRDSGIGIPPEKKKELFDPFTQVDVSSTRRYGGTGLGLAIVKRIVELVGGSVDVESIPGEGSCFTVTMILPTVDTPKTSGTERSSPEQFREVFSGARVLVVEDNSQNQLIMKVLLKRFGIEAEIVGDGVEAVESCRKSDYDLVFMDCRLPRLDGYEASRQIRDSEKEGRKVPIVALTASSYDGAREECLAAGMDDYITKPVTLKSVTTVLSEWLSPQTSIS